MSIQSFIIHRHGARYPLKRPEHNVLWPSEKTFWKQHLGKLTPVGVIQMSNLGSYFRQRYPWVNIKNVNIYSTRRSRALESAWSFCTGLLPGEPVKFNSIRTNEKCDEDCCNVDVCCINYYSKKSDDPIFGKFDPSLAYKININESFFLKELVENPKIINLIDRLSKNGVFRIRRDSITTISKLKDIYGQLQVDAQLGISEKNNLVGKYDLTDEELELIYQIGYEVIHRRMIPCTDLTEDDIFNIDQGKGIAKKIYSLMNQKSTENVLHVFSCHDTNMIAFMSVLGIKIIPPEFAGYILIEKYENSVEVFYCFNPFDGPSTIKPKKWKQHTYFQYWDDLESGSFSVKEFMNVLQSI